MSVRRKLAQLALVTALLLTVGLLNRYTTISTDVDEGLKGSGRNHNVSAVQESEGLRWPYSSQLRVAKPSTIGHAEANPFRKTESDFTRMLVIPRMQDDDISWISEELPGLNVTVYVANDPLASTHPPKNKGHEVMIYLTYIIEHYHQLPDIVIFMHAHRWTHHNNALLQYDGSQMIKRLSGAYVTRQGYVNMRCHWSPGCPEWLHFDGPVESLGKQEEAVLSDCWSELFPLDPLPETLSQPCCAQFALSRERIRSIPLNRFIFYRDWIMRTPLSDYISGRIWEYSWQYLFTGQGVLCPAEHFCYCDGFGVCFGGASEYSDYEETRRTLVDYQEQLKDLLQRQALQSEADNIPNGPAKLSYLDEKVRALDKELVARRHDAMNQGNDPRKRAEECGRQWHEGDGF